MLLAAHNRFAEDDRDAFERFLNAIVVVSFRYNVIGRRQANEQEAVYNRIAQTLSTGSIGWREAVAALRPVYLEDRAFRAAFAGAQLRTHRHRRLVRFILLRLERRVSGREFDLESDAYNIEHVLPERPDSEGWAHFDDRQREDCTYRLGNMTLLETAANRNIGNAEYGMKRQAYAASEFGLARRIAEEFETWSPEKVYAQQDWMARQASTIWRIDFAGLRSPG